MREMIASSRSGSRFIPPTLPRDRRSAHHPAIDQVEQDRLIAELRDALLALRAHVNGRRDVRAKQLHKDVQSGKNRAPETMGILLTEAYNDRAPLSDVERISHIITSFFRSKRQGGVRKLRDLSPVETREEGELNCIQVAIDQGDHSAPMLNRLIEELERNIAILTEMRESALEERYGQEART
jgi:hypothetical protein